MAAVDCTDHQGAIELFRLVASMAAERDRNQLAIICLEAACRIAGARYGTLWVLDATAKTLVPRASSPPASGEAVLPLYPGGQPDMLDPRCWAAFTGRAAVIADTRRLVGFSQDNLRRRDRAQGRVTRNLLVTALRGYDQTTVGILELSDLEDDEGGLLDETGLEAMRNLVGAFAHQAATTLATTTLLEKNEALLAELERANRQLEHENNFLKRRAVGIVSRHEGLVTASPVMERVLEIVGKVADSNVPVLVLGETGTGKDVLARLVHAASGRADRPMVTQNCAAIPSELLESELFGHRKGAFTGALSDKRGLFAVAHEGTLFLDEIGDMPLALQAKLLRVLQDGEIRPLGGTEVVRCDVRLIAATHVDLRARVADGRFREDLYYRIAVFPVTLPPLRDRTGDVELLARWFARRAASQHGRPDAGIAPGAIEALSAYAFPGNVRELINVMERATILSRPGEPIGPEDLPPEIVSHRGAPASRHPPSAIPRTAPTGAEEAMLRDTVRAHEARRIAEALAAAGGNRTRAAEALGMSRRTIQEKIARYGLGGRMGVAEATSGPPQTAPS